MRTAIETEEGISEGHSVIGLARLLMIPGIALTLMLTLILGSAAQPSTPAQAGLAEPGRRQADEAYTLYIYAGHSIYASALDLAEQSRGGVSGAEPLPDWYARVDTPAEEAEVMKAWEHANWIRSDLGLPTIGLVDLRRPGEEALRVAATAAPTLPADNVGFTVAAFVLPATGSAEPVGSRTLWDVRTPGLTSPAHYYRLFQEIQTFEATCRTGMRQGQSTWVLNVLEGELTVFVGDRKGFFRTGQTAVIPPGLLYWFGNEGTSRLRLQSSVIVPDWEGPLRPITVTPTCPGQSQRVTQIYIAKAPADIDLIQQGAELRTGYSSRVTVHAHNSLTVLSGELTVTQEDGTLRRIAPVSGPQAQGESLPLGATVTIANHGADTATYMATWLVPAGTEPVSGP